MNHVLCKIDVRWFINNETTLTLYTNIISLGDISFMDICGGKLPSRENLSGCVTGLLYNNYKTM